MAAEKPGEVCTFTGDCPQAQPEPRNLGIVPGGEFANCGDVCTKDAPTYPTAGERQYDDGVQCTVDSFDAAFAKIPEDLLCTDTGDCPDKNK